MAALLIFRLLAVAAVFIAAGPSSSASSTTVALECGRGEWFDAASDDPECVTCVHETWCPASRSDASECRHGHHGFGCSKCDEGFFFDARERCKECPSTSIVILGWTGAIVACGIIAVAIYLNAENWMDSAAVTIVTTHFQLSYVYFSFGFAFPKIVVAFSQPFGALVGFGFFTSVVEGWAAPACMGLGYVPYSVLWVLEQAFPFAFMLPFALMFLRSEKRQAAWRESDESKHPRNRILSLRDYEERQAARLVSKRAVQSILLVCISALMSGIQSSVNIWTCAEASDGSMRLIGDAAVVCDHSDPVYFSLVVASVIVFAFYYLSISGFLAVIIEREEGRRSAAEHYITHARLLRDATLAQQLKFSYNNFVQGPHYGDKLERRRLFRRLRASNKVPVAVMRLKLLTTQTAHQRAAFQLELGHAREALAKYNKLRRRPPKPDPSFFLHCYPVWVKDRWTQEWVKGIFHGCDESGRPLVATGEGEQLTYVAYDSARMDFEDKKPVVVTNDLLAWQQQEHDHLNAMSGAPIGEFGRISLKKTDRAAESGQTIRDSQEDATSEAPHVKISMPRTALFVFHLNLTEPMGFKVRERLGKVYVRDVDGSGQGAVAGMSKMCVVCRIGGKTVRTQEEFQLAIVKRRIVSAQLRKRELAKLVEGDPAAIPTIPLSGEDKALLAKVDVAKLISEVEHSELEAEIMDVEGGMLAHCSVTYLDLTYKTYRNLPFDFNAFNKIATYKPEEPYWEMYGFIISRFKSSSRHYEQWANLRKVAAVLVQVSLAPYKTTVQATTMIGICFIALGLQVRLQPYDDMNIMNEMNSADAVISNNVLETSLLVLQIIQLSLGLLTLFADLPEALSATLYIIIIFTGLGLSLVALSTELAKTVYSFLHFIEPYVNSLLAVFGYARDDNAEGDVHAKRRHLARMSAIKNKSFNQANGNGSFKAENKHQSTSAQLSALLDIATTYEADKVQDKTNDGEAKVDHSKDTEGRESSKKALREHRAVLHAEKEMLTKAKDSWVERQAQRRGSHLTTLADKMDEHAYTKTDGAILRDEDRIAHQKEILETSKDFELTKAKNEWQQRHSSVDGGHTKTESLGHFSHTTDSVIARRKAYEKQMEEKKVANNKMAADKAAWLARTKMHKTTTFSKESAHFEIDTLGAKHREAHRLSALDAKAAKVEAEAAVGKQWAARQKHGHEHHGTKHNGHTEAEDIGRLARQTESAVRRKQTWEAEKAAAIKKAKQEEEETKQTARLWQERQAKKKGSAKALSRQPNVASVSSLGEHPSRHASLDRVPGLRGRRSPDAETASDSGTVDLIGSNSWEDDAVTSRDNDAAMSPSARSSASFDLNSVLGADELTSIIPSPKSAKSSSSKSSSYSRREASLSASRLLTVADRGSTCSASVEDVLSPPVRQQSLGAELV